MFSVPMVVGRTDAYDGVLASGMDACGNGGESIADGCGGLGAAQMVGPAASRVAQMAGAVASRAGTERDGEKYFFYSLWVVHSPMGDFCYGLLYCFFYSVSAKSIRNNLVPMDCF